MRLFMMAGNLKNQAMNSDLILVIQKVRNGVSVLLQKADIKTMADQGETSHIQSSLRWKSNMPTDQQEGHIQRNKIAYNSIAVPGIQNA